MNLFILLSRLGTWTGHVVQANAVAVDPAKHRVLYIYITRKFDTGSDILEEKTTVNLAMRL